MHQNNRHLRRNRNAEIFMCPLMYAIASLREFLCSDRDYDCDSGGAIGENVKSCHLESIRR